MRGSINVIDQHRWSAFNLRLAFNQLMDYYCELPILNQWKRSKVKKLVYKTISTNQVSTTQIKKALKRVENKTIGYIYPLNVTNFVRVVKRIHDCLKKIDVPNTETAKLQRETVNIFESCNGTLTETYIPLQYHCLKNLIYEGRMKIAKDLLVGNIESKLNIKIR